MIVTSKLKKFDRTWRVSTDTNVPLFWVNRKHISDEVIHEFLDFCLIWCVRKFGQDEKLDIPEIFWEWNDADLKHADMLAIYDDAENSITLRVQGHRTFYNLAKTIVHEYVHYLQPRIGNWYERHYRKYGYDDHPYEKEAYYIADLYGVECARWAMHQIQLTHGNI